MKKRGSELLLTNSATRTNSQNNMTLQLAPTPLSSMSALRSQNNTTACPRKFGLFIASFSPHMQIDAIGI